KSNLPIEKFEFTLIDADKEAISYSQERITNLLKRSDRRPKVNFVNKAVDQIIKEKDLFDNLGKYDLIYSVGLFDYLTVNLSKRVTKTLYHFLKSNARLIIGNFNLSTDESRTYMDFVLEWYLLYRSEAEMLKFTEKLENPKKVYFEKDSTGLTNFLIIEK
ncbi:MAG: hypothetical protein HQ595_01000, partial [Candidatus Omnitrophica bacterium]|nr:hypothetical protein [Candidatus Omnitrophota bacterium]